MEHYKKIEIISNAIRNDIPRLKELKKGCKVVTDKGNKIITIGEDSYDIASDNVIIDSQAPSEARHKYQNITKIIGHNPQLNDVLQWFLLIPGDTEINISEKTNHICLILNGNQIDIDLTKSYLKDWDENTIDLIYKFKKW